MGASMAEGFAREGAKVVVTARTEQEYAANRPGTVYDVVERIKESGGTAIAVRCDVNIEEDRVALVETTKAAFGPCDLLVNNAALTIPGMPPKPGDQPQAARAAYTPPAFGPGGTKFNALSFLTFPITGYRAQFDVNLHAPYRLMQLVLPDMVQARKGSVINISSGASIGPGEGPYGEWKPGAFAYGGSKIALEHLTQSVAAEMAQYGITVNALSPSLPVPTPGTAWLGLDLTKDVTTTDEFTEAAIRLALETPDGINGRVNYNLDVIHPELGRRGSLSRGRAPE